MKEEWRDIPQYEGLYQVSNNGRIRSVERIVRRNGNTIKRLRSVVLRPQFQKNGYMFVALSKNGEVKQILVHRAVAVAFISNPLSKPEVNHINENKRDNRATNLEWMTIAENRAYGTRIQRGVAHRDQTGEKNGMYGKKGNLNPRSKRVIQFDLQGNFLAEYESIRIAAKETNSSPTAISRVAKGFLKTTNSSIWKYK